MVGIDLLELMTKLDKIPCKPRLRPTKVCALQILTGDKFDELIDKKIIQPLSKVTAFTGPPIRYRFTRETINPLGDDSTPLTFPHQFISDFSVFGLREAIAYFHTYEFISAPGGLIDNAIAVYHKIAKAYLDNIKKLEKSDNEEIKKLMLIAKLYGEGAPQHIKKQYR